MLVCHCRAVNDRRIRQEIEHGARDEFDVAEVCGAGTVCGGCVPLVSEILAESGYAPRCPVASALRALAGPDPAGQAPPEAPGPGDPAPGAPSWT